MELYLVQHGEAKAETEDAARPLTDGGRQTVERMARAVARAGLRVDRIAHSGKLRARRTAEILAAELRPPGGLAALAGLAPSDDPAIARRVVAELTAPALLVGHLPHLSRLASLLVVGEQAPEIVAFRMGGIVCLGDDAGRWRVQWILTPDLVP